MGFDQIILCYSYKLKVLIFFFEIVMKITFSGLFINLFFCISLLGIFKVKLIQHVWRVEKSGFFVVVLGSVIIFTIWVA